MKCIIPGPNVKVLGRAIHSLAKLGDSLYVESSANDLSFRTVNMSKTAYASFTFTMDFFSFFSGDCYDDPNSNCIKCQISMRSSLAIFRSPVTLDKTVESLQIQLHPNSDKLIFVLKYKKGVLKTFNVPIIECETLQAYYHKNTSPNRLTIQPKIVDNILLNFQANQGEITWNVTKDNVVIRNYSDSEDVFPGVRTETSLERDEFDEFKIQKETEITFCLKELRAVLLFSDSVGLPLTASFNVASKPIVFVVKNEVFEANIVVSTLTGKDYVESQSESQLTDRDNSSQRNGRVVGLERETSQRNEFVGRPSVRMANDSIPVLPNLEDENANNDVSVNTIANREKLKQVFQKCFQKEKYDVRNMPGYDVVLAPDSDSDEY